MKIGVLAAGGTPPKLVSTFGSDGNMLRRFLGPAFKLKAFDVKAGVLPADDDDCDAYLINGSSASVLTEDAWIKALQSFVIRRVGSKPMIGICFGHQLIARALGGEVMRSPTGWQLGLKRYDVLNRTSWMDAARSFALSAAHQDEVIAIGPDARVVAGNLKTPFALLDYPGHRLLTLQAHPEFDADYTKALIDLQRNDGVDDGAADAAIASLDEVDDRRRVAVWIRRFLNTP